MMPRTIFSNDPEATRDLAREIAADVAAPVVIALYGDLGAGKTLFAQALARALGVTAPVTSPTFTLVNEYDLPDGGKLFHVDTYRLHDALAEASALGLEELFDEGVVIIEWAGRIQSLLPRRRLDIYIEHVGENARRFTIYDYRKSDEA